MTIPFLDLVRRAKEKFEGKRRPTGLAPLPSVEDKPQSDKLAKRVMPYAVRTMTPEPTAPALAAASAIATRRTSVTHQSAGPPDLGPSVGVCSGTAWGKDTLSCLERRHCGNAEWLSQTARKFRYQPTDNVESGGGRERFGSRPSRHFDRSDLPASAGNIPAHRATVRYRGGDVAGQEGNR